MSKQLSYPFSIATNGAVATSTDPRKIWQDRVRAVINTQVGDRVMRPGFGTNTAGAVMNYGTPAQNELTQNIKTAFVTWLPSLNVNNIDVSMDDASAVLTVQVWFTLPSGEQTTASVSYDAGRVVAETENFGV
jgi:phage baseplate assembly protein W